MSSASVMAIKKTIDQAKEKYKRVCAGVQQSTDSLNLLLQEVVGRKDIGVAAFQNYEIEGKFTIEIQFYCASMQTPLRQRIGKVSCDFPIPSAEQICQMINRELNQQLVDSESALMCMLSIATELPQEKLIQGVD